jgi:large subunit ribosomal protein L28e
MVNVPDQLVWEIVRKNNSFLVKKNGHTKRSGAVQFSSEKGNLKSLNMLKYSGIANSKTIDVIADEDNRAMLVTKVASKAGKKSALKTESINRDFRRAEKILLRQTTDVYYRRDLKNAALAKFTKVYQANRRAKGITKPVAVKKGRGKL